MSLSHDDTAVSVDVGEILEDDLLVGGPNVCIKPSNHLAGEPIVESTSTTEVL